VKEGSLKDGDDSIESRVARAVEERSLKDGDDSIQLVTMVRQVILVLLGMIIAVLIRWKGGRSAELNLMVKVFIFTSRKSSVDISVCKSVLVFCRIHAW